MCDHWWVMLDKIFNHVNTIFFVSLLSSIDFQCYDHLVSLLRPLSCLTRFCDHNFSLICRFKLQFSQNYINIDTDETQYWFCYFVQSLWNKNTIIYMIGRTVAHFTIFSSPIRVNIQFKGSFNLYLKKIISRFQLYILGSDIEGRVYVIHI